MNLNLGESLAVEALGDMAQYKTVLYVGANPRQFQLYGFLKATQLYVLEIWPAYAELLRSESKYPVAGIFLGDIRNAATMPELEAVAPFDALIWWHGPEHVSERDARLLLEPASTLHWLYSKLLLIGAPFGHYRQGPVDGNPHQTHQWNPTVHWFEALGFQVDSVGAAGVPRSGIVAWMRRHTS